MKSIFPLILVVLLLIGAITYSLSKRIVPKEAETRFGIAANELKDNSIDNVADTAGKTAFNPVTPTPSATPVITPVVTPAPLVVEAKITDLPSVGQKGGVEAEIVVPKIIKTTKTVVCTPVYGQANTCTEHLVVDTGAQDSLFFNMAGFAYLAGLASFVFAKRA